MLLTERFAQAFLFAHILHQNQKRKGTDVPYISHLLGVCSLVLEHGGNEDQAIAALLHDAVEDQGENYVGGVEQLRKDIEDEFGVTVLRIVNGCTDADTVPKPPWRERKEAYIEHIQNADSDIRFVSCCDKLHNARAILTDYVAVGDNLWDRFNADKEDILWYYQSLADAFREKERSSLTDELSRVVSELETETVIDKDKYFTDENGKVVRDSNGKKIPLEMFDEDPIFEQVYANDEEIDAEIKRLGLNDHLPEVNK